MQKTGEAMEKLVLSTVSFSSNDCFYPVWHRIDQFFRSWGGIFAHSSRSWSSNSVAFRGSTCLLRTRRSTSSQRNSIGFKSGLCGTHSSTFMPLVSKKSLMRCDVWIGAISCWKSISAISGRNGSSSCSRIARYSMEFMLLVHLTNGPVPLTVK